MPWGFAAAAVGSIAGAAISSSGAQSAADTQAQATQSGIDQQNYEFNTVQGLLKPYVDAGTGALPGYNNAVNTYAGTLGQLGNITGANGNAAQQTAIQGLQSSPLYTNAMQLGQQSILQSASATGGLRGGNTVASLGYLPSQVLANTMQQQIGNLGTSLSGTQGLLGAYGQLMSLGQNSAAGTGNAGIQTGNNITNLLGQQGAIGAGATLAGTNAASGAVNQFGTYLGSSGGQSAIQALMGAGGIGGTSGGYSFSTPSTFSMPSNDPSYGLSPTYGLG